MARTRASIAEGIPASTMVTDFSRPPMPKRDTIIRAIAGAIPNFMTDTNDASFICSLIPLNSIDSPKDIIMRGIVAPLK